MKKLFIYATLMMAIISGSAYAQKTDVLNRKENIKVWGNCETCKKRIENAAISAGAVRAYWDDQTHILKVNYDGAKTSNEKIQKKIAAAGYDTESFSADKTAYDRLPSCCRYDRKIN